MLKDIIKNIKIEVNFQLDNINKENIIDICKKIENCTGNIYLTGIGKSENIAKHCCSLLKCINIKAFYLDPTNCLHGDIGTVNQNDIVLLFSKSGNTSELLLLLEYLKVKKSYNIGICCNEKSNFNTSCNTVLVLPLIDEIQGNIQTIPTNSYMSQLLFSNLLVTYLSKNITLKNYKDNHPAGNIGNKLKTINDIINYNFPKIVFDTEYIDLHLILLEMTKYSIGCCFFVNKDNEMIGLLTDGDIRRLIVKKTNFKKINKSNINNIFSFETQLDKLLINISDSFKTKFIPILQNGKLYGIIDCRKF